MSFDEELGVDEFIDAGEEHQDGGYAEPIAVIAFTGRFPGAANTDIFWTNLRDGVESVKFFTDEELASENIDPNILANPKFVRADAVLDHIDLFDADFFKYSPREAEIMDPQHRLFLECSWEVMELAGYNPETYKGRVGVFGGSGLSSYLIRNLLKNSEFVDSVGSFNTMLGNSQDFLATKVSYKMNLMGPSLNTNTLCSSSSVSVHLACQSLWNYQTDMNLAGGVSIQISRNEAFFYQEGGIGAFDGHCRAFDERAGGTVSGSGLGILMLKRLEDARSDGDTIHALIVGSAINNDGSVKLSYTAPSIDGQAEVIGEALAVGGINPETISYLECHGTGTSLGDPVEISGLTKAFRAYTDKKGYCPVGSVKTNIGHLVTAGGVASMIKTILAMKHRQIPPSLNYERPNPKIDFVNSPFFVNTSLRPWETAAGVPMRAGVSSFGIGGTNAHQVLEEAPELEPTEAGRPFQLLPFSARSESALAAARANLAAHLKANPEVNFEDAAYTMRVGRKAFNYRAFLVAATGEEAIAQLEDIASAKVSSTFQENEDRPVAFLFSGQGSQYIGMAKGLYESEPVFRAHVDEAAKLLAGPLSLDLREVMWPSQADEAAAQRLQRTAMTQPALFTIAHAQARLLNSWGIQPVAMLGHSIGEYVAAHLAGVFSLEDVLSLVAERGRLIDSLPAGDMLAVPLSEVEVNRSLPTGLSLAAVNGATNCVVSGPSGEVEAYRQTLSDRGVEARLLHTSHAFHSRMMEPILEAFTAKVAACKRQAPAINFVSNVTGTWITAEEAVDPNYWAQHLRGTVRFHDGLGTLLAQGEPILLEAGPGRTLATLAKQYPLQGKRPPVVHSIRHPQEKVEDAAFLQEALGRLWLAGAKVDWIGYHDGQIRRRVPMPTYPFERRRYWIEPDMLGYQKGASDDRLLGIRKDKRDDWFYVPTWQTTALPQIPLELPPKEIWMLLSDGSNAALGLSRRLVDEGQVVVTVTIGPSYGKLEHGIYQVRANQPNDFSVMFDDLKQENMTPKSLVFFADHHQADAVDLFNTLRHTCQALADGDQTLQLAVISSTEEAQVGVPGETSTGLIRGLLKVIPHEMPNITSRLIEVARPAVGHWQYKRLVDQLVAELTGDRGENHVAYRTNQRWVRAFGASPLAKRGHGDLRDGGTYLIVGGLQGTGLKIAEHFAGKARLNLVVTAETPFPAQDQWAHLTDPIERETATVLQRIQKAGVKLLLKQVNPADRLQMEQLVEATRQFGTLNGVIFAHGPAGRNLIGPMTEMRDETLVFLEQLTSGLDHLEQSLADQPLDFCVLLSSTASELGGLGLGAYAAANAYVDTFVARQNASPAAPWTSFNWDGWLSAAERTAAVGETHARLALSWEEGLDALDRVLAHRVIGQVALSTEDMPARLRRQNNDLVERDQKQAQVYTVHPRPNLTNPYVAPRSETEKKIAAIWQDRLGIESVGINDNYFDLGGDSLLVVKIRRALQEQFGGELLTSDLFEHPTVAALAAYFDEQERDQTQDRAKDRAALQKAAMEAEMEQMRSRRTRRR